MTTLIKIIVTILIFLVATPLSVAIGKEPILRILLLAGLIAAIVAVWKYKPEGDKTNNDHHHLDKS